VLHSLLQRVACAQLRDAAQIQGWRPILHPLLAEEAGLSSGKTLTLPVLPSLFVG
jgi:hypothetical protein